MIVRFGIKCLYQYLTNYTILNYMLKRRVAILSVINIVIVFWIVWFERQIQYEPLLDYDSNIGAKLLPLHSEVYNTMIIAIIINMIVLAFESRIRRIRKYMKCDLIIAFAYLFLITFCILAGYFFILSRIQDGVIDEHNALFQFPIWLFGKDSFSSVITVTGLYSSLCIIHICICLFYLYSCVKQYKRCKKDM